MFSESSSINFFALISERVRKMILSMQKASPKTKANATNDIKPAFPSMNFVLSAL